MSTGNDTTPFQGYIFKGFFTLVSTIAISLLGGIYIEIKTLGKSVAVVETNIDNIIEKNHEQDAKIEHLQDYFFDKPKPITIPLPQ